MRKAYIVEKSGGFLKTEDAIELVDCVVIAMSEEFPLELSVIKQPVTNDGAELQVTERLQGRREGRTLKRPVPRRSSQATQTRSR